MFGWWLWIWVWVERITNDDDKFVFQSADDAPTLFQPRLTFPLFILTTDHKTSCKTVPLFCLFRLVFSQKTLPKHARKGTMKVVTLYLIAALFSALSVLAFQPLRQSHSFARQAGRASRASSLWRPPGQLPAQDQTIQELEQDASSLMPQDGSGMSKKNNLAKATVAGLAVALAMVPERSPFPLWQASIP